ncbi:MAG TPA: cupin domain-containing protein [Chlorobaculum parvum]|uniref:Cupin domain-containing protein n=1 Tax=Chlorobaculum parvum TaxID=274539 RepID=A0A7C5H9W8_9CHLB|nr:cupin domain-containing protein [Chlorobaculum parvum]
MRTAEFWIDRLRLERHPEGGWYRETYRGEGQYDFSGAGPFGSARSYATSIYYLLEHGDRSRLHRIHSDEQWYFHTGSPLEVHSFPEAGEPSSFTLGYDPDAGQVLHSWVPAESWFGASLTKSDDPGTYVLVSCVVAPGFDFHDFTFADREKLLALFPAHAPIIDKLS